MTTHDCTTLSLLGDSDLTIADADEDIRGRIVRKKDGTEIGKIDNLLIDTDDRRVCYMRVEPGGFLGMGETQVFIPIDAITMVTDVDVRIDLSHEHVSREPRDEPCLVTEQRYLGNMSY